MVRFTEFDACLLWCVPDPGCDLAYLIRAYIFLNRDAAPSYAELAGCLGRAVLAGVMPLPIAGHYQLTPEWHQRVHQYDEQYTVPEYGMVESAEVLPSCEWPVMTRTNFVLNRNQYEAAVAGHPKRPEPFKGL